MESAQEKNRSWLRITLIIVILVALALIFDLDQVFDLLLATQWGFLALGLVFVLLAYLFLAIRWRLLLGNRTETTYSFHSLNAANFTNLVAFIPVTATRIFLMGQDKQVGTARATSSVGVIIMLDWLMRFVTIFVTLLLGVRLISDSNQWIVFAIFFLFFALLASVFWVIRNIEAFSVFVERILNRVPIVSEDQAARVTEGLSEGLKEAGTPRQFALGTLWSLLGWLGFFLFYFFGGMAIGLDDNMSTLILVALVALIFAPPAAPYLPGVYQTLLTVPIALFTRLQSDEALAYSIAVHIPLLLYWLGAGLIAFRVLNLNLGEIRQSVSQAIDESRSAAANTQD